MPQRPDRKIGPFCFACLWHPMPPHWRLLHVNALALPPILTIIPIALTSPRTAKAHAWHTNLTFPWTSDGSYCSKTLACNPGMSCAGPCCRKTRCRAKITG